MKLDIKLATILFFVAALFTWSLYRLLYEVTGEMLASIGISGNIYQNLAIVLITGLILVLNKKSIKKVLKLK